MQLLHMQQPRPNRISQRPSPSRLSQLFSCYNVGIRNCHFLVRNWKHCQPSCLGLTTTNADHHADQMDADLDMPPPIATFMTHGQNIADFLKDVMTTPSSPLNAMHVDSGGPQGVLDFTVDVDLDLNDADFGFFDKLYSNSFDDIPPPPQLAAGLTLQAVQQRTPLRQHSPSRYQLHPPQDTVPIPSMHSLQPQHDQSMHSHVEPSHSIPGAQMQRATTTATTATATALSTASTAVATARQHVALGAEAFRRSAFGAWLPARQDCGDFELENLSILSPEVASPDTRINLDRHFLRERLGRTTRDEFLAMILGTCRPDKVPLIVRTFPTSGLLDDLLECFFACHQQQVDCFVHTASFQPNQQKCELLGVMIATGATKTDVKALHKLGFAIQEAVRTIIPQRCEEANANTRKLWLLQSFMFVLQVGIWSGIKRKMELAESHTQVIFTVGYHIVLYRTSLF
jgi:hypothetical protein